MPSSYTSSLRLTLPATGELTGTWGTTVNDGITTLLDKAVAGASTITMTAADYTLTTSNGANDEARSMTLVLTGTPGAARNVICPAVSKTYIVYNNTTGGFAQTIKTSAGTGVSVPNGKTKIVRCDGTNVVEGFDAADTLALTGGTANGVLYLNGSKVATSGTGLVFDGTNLGIGTNSPGAKLDVRSAIGTSVDATPQNILAIDTTAYAQGNGGGITFGYVYNSGGLIINRAAVIKGIKENATDGNYASALTFSTTANSASTTERMRLDSSGNLGIGTSSPAYKVDASGQVRALESGTGSGDGGFVASTSGANGNAGVLFQTNSASRWNLTTAGTAGANLRIYNYALASTVATFDASGNLGLGVTPSAWSGGFKALQVSNGTLAGYASGTNVQVEVLSNAYQSSLGVYNYITNAAASQYRQISGEHQWKVAGSGTAGAAISFTQAMTLDASGNLGVGVTGPTAKLHIYEPTAAATRIRVLANGGQQAALQLAGNGTTFGTTSFDVFQDGGSDAYVANRANAALQFWTNNTERARITSGGDLWVGTTTSLASYRLQVASGSNSGGIFQTTAAGSFGATAWNTATSGDNLFFGMFTEGTATQRGSIDYNRAGGLVRYNTTSDYRAKDIIGPVQNPGATIDALKVYEGVMKGATQSRPMLIAHEAQAHAPYAVSGVKDEVNEDGTPKFQQMDVSSLVPLLLAEIQSLRARVAALEAA